MLELAGLLLPTPATPPGVICVVGPDTELVPVFPPLLDPTPPLPLPPLLPLLPTDASRCAAAPGLAPESFDSRLLSLCAKSVVLFTSE